MFAHVTTHIAGRAYDDLLGAKGFGAFPSIAALDEQGDVIAKLSGGRDVPGFESMMESATRFVTVRRKAEKTLDDHVYLLAHEMEMGSVGVDAARARIAALEGLTGGRLSDEQKQTLDGHLTDLEIRAAIGKANSREEAAILAKAAAKKFAAMWEAGREPRSDEAFQPFYILILDHAEEQGDAALFERALAKLKGRFGDNPRATRFFEAQDARLEKLKSRDDAGGESGDDADGESGDDADDGG